MIKSVYREPSIYDNDFAAADVWLQVNCTGTNCYDQANTIYSKRSDYYLLLVRRGVLYIDSPVKNCSEIHTSGFIIFEKNCPYGYHADIGMEYHWIHFGGHNAPSLLSYCHIQPGTAYPLQDTSSFDVPFRMLFDTFLQRDALFDIDTAQQLCAILVRLGRLSSANTDRQSQSFQLTDTLHYIHEHFAEPLRVTELAARQYMSVSHFRDMFCRIMQQSPQEYILSIRIRQACDLLLKTSIPIYAVAAH